MDGLNFLLEDYKLKAQYVSDHFARMWTRFNFFLTIDAALYGLSFDRDHAHYVLPMAISGFALSLVWALFGYLDQRAADRYRLHVRTVFHALCRNIRRGGITPLLLDPASEGPLDFRNKLSYVGDTRRGRWIEPRNRRAGASGFVVRSGAAFGSPRSPG